MASSGTNGTIKWAISGTTLRLYPASGSSGTANPLRSGAADGLIMWITLTDSERLAITKIKTEGTLLFNTNAIGGGYTPLTQYRALTTYSNITKYFTNLEEIDVSGLKAAGGTDFSDMFSNSTGQRDKLTTITGLSSLNTSSATNYDSMFEGTKVPSLDISSFKNMNTANICEMFRDTPYLMSVKLPSSFARKSDARTTNFGLAPATNANGITVKYDAYFFKLPSSQQGGLWTRNVTGDLKFSARATRTSSGAEIHCTYSTTKASTAAFYIKKQTDSSWPSTSVATMSFSSSGSADQTIELPTDDSYDILINVSDGDTTLYVIPSVTSNKLLFAIDDAGNLDVTGHITSAISGCGATASISLTTNTSGVKIPITTYRGKVGSYLSISNDGIKCEKKGHVEISACAYFIDGFTANSLVHIIIKKNSTTVTNAVHRLPSHYDYYSISPLVYSVSAGDILYLYAYNQTDAKGKVAGDSRTWLTVKYL